MVVSCKVTSVCKLALCSTTTYLELYLIVVGRGIFELKLKDRLWCILLVVVPKVCKVFIKSELSRLNNFVKAFLSLCKITQTSFFWSRHKRLSKHGKGCPSSGTTRLLGFRTILSSFLEVVNYKLPCVFKRLTSIA